MPTDRNRERVPWDMAAGAGPPEDWLAIVIRQALQSSVNNAEPPPTIWVQIRQNIEAMVPSLAQEEDPMLSDRDLLVHQESYKDRLQEARHERLIQAAGLRRPGSWRLPQKVAGWLGTQMVRWGQKLQHYGTAPSFCCPQVACDH